jgi:hypothetical protein
MRGGERLVEGAGEQAADDVQGLARRLWDRLQPKIPERAAAYQAAEDAAERPDDEDAAGAIRLEIRKILDEDPELARWVAGLLNYPSGRGKTRRQRVLDLERWTDEQMAKQARELRRSPPSSGRLPS